MKFPYGISDFFKINTQGYYYCDRTDKIPLLEQADSQLFIRPRRFGKSLVLSMLENYYDVEKAKYFKELFGNLAIGKNPTKLHNSYFILKWGFSRYYSYTGSLIFLIYLYGNYVCYCFLS